MNLKKILIKSLSISLFAASSFALASSLVVVNNTNRDSSVTIQEAGNTCSPKITTAHTTSHTPSFLVRALCKRNVICHATMYPSAHCNKTGTPVAKLTMNTQTMTITDISMTDTAYSVTANGSTVTISGGPA